MPMTRGTALIAEARVVELTGRQDLARLETGGEFDRDSLLITASDWVYDGLEGVGIDPTLLTNQTRYERAVAAYFLFLLAEGGYIGEDSAPLFERAQTEFGRVRPELSAGDEGHMTNAPVPTIINFDADAIYGPSTQPSTAPQYWESEYPNTR